MPKTLAEIKANMQANKENTRRKIEEATSGGGKREKDATIWNLERDKSGVGSATFRFLPARADEESPYVTLYSYGFQGPTGKWYLEESLQTIGKADPVGEENSRLWQTGEESNIAIARKRARRTHYMSNILMIDDPAHPENNGKVFRFKYGKKIMNKIKDQIDPPFKGDPSVDPFCFFGGANFRLKVRNVDDYPNYDSSTFDSPSPLFNGDEAKIQAVWDAEYTLKDYLDPSRFKSYEELKKRFEEVINGTGGGGTTPAPATGKSAKAPAPNATKTVVPQDDDEPPFDIPRTTKATAAGAGAGKDRLKEEEDAFAALVDSE